MDLLKSRQLLEQRAKLIEEARKAPDATAEDRAKIDKMLEDARSLKAQAEQWAAVEAEEREHTVPHISEPTEDPKAGIEAEGRAYSEAFKAYLRHGENGMTPEQRATLRKGYRDAEGRAQTITTTAGGYIIPQGFMAELERAQKQYGGVLSIARQLNTSGGNAMPWPTIDDTSNTGEDKAINTAASEQALTFGQVTLNAYKMDSGLVLCPNELFEDEGINLEAELGSILGERLGRRRNAKYTTGSGSSDYQGVTIGASLGGTFAGVAAITADELFDVQHSVDPAYRNSPKCAWMFNDTVFKMVRKLKDGQNRYLFEPAITAGAPDMLLGKPIIINQDMPAPTTGLRSVVFGDFSKFIVRNVRNVVVKRSTELYFLSDQVGFVAWYRGDSKVVSASSSALIYWKQA